MTSKLKCPFCGEEIVGVPNLAQTRTIGFRCYNIQCKAFNHFMPVFILQALIQAKQDLKIATKAADNSREKLAAFMHDTWGNWFAYQLNNSTVENLQRWVIQSNTPYSSLSETDKDKDRKFADKIIEIIKEQIDHFADVSKMIEHKEQ